MDAHSRQQPPAGTPARWGFRLYITGHTPKSQRAVLNLQKICEEVLGGDCQMEIVDLLKDPRQAATDNILATPTVVRLAPPPVRKVIGDLSDRERVLDSLRLR